MPIRVEEYVCEGGFCPFRAWFDRLPAQAAAKVTTATFRVSEGNTSAIKWFSGLGEIRIDWGPGYRVYLVKDGEALIVLFGGGTKTSQSKDIVRARHLLAEYKFRKQARSDAAKSKR